MKTNVNIFNALNESFNDTVKTKKQVFIEGDKVTIKEAEEEVKPDLKDKEILTEVKPEESTFEIDYAGEGVDLSTEESVIKAVRDWLGALANEVKIEVLKLNGPAAGWPVVRLTGNKEKIAKFLLDNFNSGAEKTLDDIYDLYLVKDNDLAESSTSTTEDTSNSESLIDKIKKRLSEIKDEEASKWEEVTTTPEQLKEDTNIVIPDTSIEPDYIITDVTILNNVGDGDVQAPDIDALLTLVNESLKADYGENWGHINTFFSKIEESGSHALVDITTPELLKEFENRGIVDVAMGKNLILENAGNGLVTFKVNALNGANRYTKNTTDAVQAIKEWIESEFLTEAKAAKEAELEALKTKTEKETIDNYIETHKDLKKEIEDIKLFIELGKSVKDEGFKQMIQDKMYGFASEFPMNVEIKNDKDNYTLSFNNIDEVVEQIFGKEWVKEIEIPEVVNLKESYEQFNIGPDLEVVFNPSTYETLYSIPSANVQDKKINLTKVPSVDTPYNTETIIKNFIETKFGRIPTEEETKVEKETTKDSTDTTPTAEPVAQSDITTEPAISTAEDNSQIEEDALPKEPAEEDNSQEDLDLDVDIDNLDQDTKENQAETGSATFIKIRPKQNANISTIREKLLDGDTPKTDYIVVDYIDLPADQWNSMLDNLTTPQSFLEGVKPLDRKNYSFNVVKVTSAESDFALLIDPLGYSYPRYVAIEQ